MGVQQIYIPDLDQNWQKIQGLIYCNIIKWVYTYSKSAMSSIKGCLPSKFVN